MAASFKRILQCSRLLQAPKAPLSTRGCQSSRTRLLRLARLVCPSADTPPLKEARQGSSLRRPMQITPLTVRQWFVAVNADTLEHDPARSPARVEEMSLQRCFEAASSRLAAAPSADQQVFDFCTPMHHGCPVFFSLAVEPPVMFPHLRPCRPRCRFRAIARWPRKQPEQPPSPHDDGIGSSLFPPERR